jgi:uncharacterized protein YbaR (Trm112 family)
MRLGLMPVGTLARLNTLIVSGGLGHRYDSRVSVALTEALFTDAERLAYPVIDDIPMLLEDRGILIAQLDEA